MIWCGFGVRVINSDNMQSGIGRSKCIVMKNGMECVVVLADFQIFE